MSRTEPVSECWSSCTIFDPIFYAKSQNESAFTDRRTAAYAVHALHCLAQYGPARFQEAEGVKADGLAQSIEMISCIPQCTSIHCDSQRSNGNTVDISSHSVLKARC